MEQVFQPTVTDPGMPIARDHWLSLSIKIDLNSHAALGGLVVAQYGD
jgi:hypothetical protein